MQVRDYSFDRTLMQMTQMCYVSDPDMPSKPAISDIEQTSVTLSWRPGESRTINSTFILYRKKYSAGRKWKIQLVPRSSGDADRSRTSVDDLRVFVLSGLEPATDYLIRVAVKSFDKRSLSPVIDFETREFCVCCFCSLLLLREFFRVAVRLEFSEGTYERFAAVARGDWN